MINDQFHFCTSSQLHYCTTDQLHTVHEDSSILYAHLCSNQLQNYIASSLYQCTIDLD